MGVQHLRDHLPILTFTAIGDAYGACFEYAPMDVIRSRNTLKGYFPHHKYAIGCGRYTDDTQMSVAVSETLIKFGGAASVCSLAESFVKAFKRDERQAIRADFVIC